MHAALTNIKPLLIRWGVVYVILVIVSSSLLISALPPAYASRQLVLSRSTKSSHQKKPTISSQTSEQKPTLQKKAKTAPKKISGNEYALGNCTWYAKHKRPDLPNNLGNADTWAVRAEAQGIPTGPLPKVGAIAQQGMHVVYVEKINGDGTILISEMNYIGLGITNNRTVAGSSFKYIY